MKMISVTTWGRAKLWINVDAIETVAEIRAPAQGEIPADDSLRSVIFLRGRNTEIPVREIIGDLLFDIGRAQ